MVLAPCNKGNQGDGQCLVNGLLRFNFLGCFIIHGVLDMKMM